MKTPELSYIIPVYNRPDEVDELLESLVSQTVKNFEVVLVEDGSSEKCEHLLEKYSPYLKIKYLFKPNSGPGLSRNYGAERAKGDYFIFFDSDCIIPEDYTQIVTDELLENRIDAFGGPDKAHPSFTPVQKAINYSMTSFLTTGGIRGGKKKMDKFYPRSFNMGISRQVYEETGGFAKMRFGEDVDFSTRIIKSGFNTRLIQNAFVYHKRRTNFWQFYKQVYNSGMARISLTLKHPGSLKIVHLLPTVFTLGSFLLILLSFFKKRFAIPLIIFKTIIFTDSLKKNKSFLVAGLSIVAAFTQLWGYGTGFLDALWKNKTSGEATFSAFKKNFYK